MKRIGSIIITALVIEIFNSCQGLTEFIPPDFKEKLTVIAIINECDKQNRIIIEKSFQREYPDDVNAHLEDLSLEIRSESQLLFDYSNHFSKNRIDTIQLPGNLNFIPGENYTLTITERNSESIISEIIVPPAPPDFDVIFENIVQSFLPAPLDCHNPVNANILRIHIKPDPGLLFFLEISGITKTPYNYLSLQLTPFEVIESDFLYFESYIPGILYINMNSCGLGYFSIPLGRHSTYLFNPGKNTGNDFRIKMNVNSNYFDYTKPFIISLVSIPRELYDFEKGYHTYLESIGDPFSEPVYINGNLKGGNGIFAICSGKQKSLLLPVE